MGEEVFKCNFYMDEVEICVFDVNQGYCGDCYLIVGMGVIVKQCLDFIKSMICDHGDGIVIVCFWVIDKGYFMFFEVGKVILVEV